MRVYDLDLSFEKLIKNEDYQIEIIGEDEGWTVTVRRREWSNELQRYEYEFVACCATGKFLGVYDFAAEIIGRTEEAEV